MIIYSVLQNVFIIHVSHQVAAPAAGLGVGVVRNIDLVLVAVHEEAPRLPLPLVVDLGDGHHPHLVPLPQDLLLGELAGVAGHQLRRGHPHHLVLEAVHRAHPPTLLLVRYLATRLAQKTIRKRMAS